MDRPRFAKTTLESKIWSVCSFVCQTLFYTICHPDSKLTKNCSRPVWLTSKWQNIVMFEFVWDRILGQFVMKTLILSPQNTWVWPGNGLLCFPWMGTFQFLINYTFDVIMVLNSFKSFQSIKYCGECGECLEEFDIMTYHLQTAHDYWIMYNCQWDKIDILRSSLQQGVF